MLFLSLKYTDIDAAVHAVKTTVARRGQTPYCRRWILSDIWCNL